MNRFKNHIFYAICEASLKYFETTDYATYSAFCIGLSNSMKLENLTKKDKKILVAVSKHIELIFALTPEEAGVYIADYLHDEKYLIFERPVRQIRNAFPNSSSF